MKEQQTLSFTSSQLHFSSISLSLSLPTFSSLLISSLYLFIIVLIISLLCRPWCFIIHYLKYIELTDNYIELLSDSLLLLLLLLLHFAITLFIYFFIIFSFSFKKVENHLRFERQI